MNNYRVAKSYEGFEFDIKKAYKNSKGKMVVDAKEPCSRCNGSGIAISHVCNGQPIPYVNDGGICYGCNGTGYFHKTIRLYTDKEFEQMERSKAKAAEKKENERVERMKAEFAQKKAEWLEKNNFNEQMTTFIYFPADSYDVKDELKAAGFRFSSDLLWHCADIPAGFEEKVVEIFFQEIGEISAWGEGHFKPEVKSIITDLIESARPQIESTSEWQGEVGERLYDIHATLKSIREIETRYGLTQLVVFEDRCGNQYNWWTSAVVKAEVGENVILAGTVKKFEEYKGVHITVLNRCRIKTD